MVKSGVALIRCAEYEDAAVQAAVKRGIDLLGGISLFARPGEKIVLKPNVLIGSPPDKSVSTHPTVFKAVGKLLLEAGVKVSYGDSSAFAGQGRNMGRSGLKSVAEELGIALADFEHGQEVSHPSALVARKMTLAKGVLEADGLISLPKLKTHGLTRFTGAVKNQFGCVPGMLKREWHLKMPDLFNFSTMLVDINTFLRPRLYIMDGIVGMEGNGPYGGKSRRMNVLLFSADPVALDAVACKMIGLNPEFVPTSKPGEQSGLGTYHYENIEILGDSLESFIVRDFKVIRSPPVAVTAGRLRSFFKNQLTPRPVIDRVKCTGCGTCIKSCPVGAKALDWGREENGKKKPSHKYSRCIRCYCCQETCPEGAITIKTPFFGRLLFRR
jgi:uncharacterized protein (DUF362 family)/ferredoxin